MSNGQHHQVWKSTHGDGPWPCYECEELVTSLGGEVTPDMGIVHHADHNPKNNVLSNLQVMHHKCHVSYHNPKRVISDESRRRMSVAQKKRRAEEAPEVRDKFVRAMLGKNHTQETRDKIRATRASRTYVLSDDARERIRDAARGNKNGVGKTKSPEVREQIAAKLRGKKKSPETIARMTEANRRIGAERRKKNQERRAQDAKEEGDDSLRTQRRNVRHCE